MQHLDPACRSRLPAQADSDRTSTTTVQRCRGRSSDRPRPGTSVLSLYASVTADGAHEVAQVVHEILTGQRCPDITLR
ncbi:hypothetical protein GCM10010195_66110 [Kitasatospora griseola]|nr:hypothetical protein GCM10010195_66110 [Kitasatospora griseola]